MLKALHTKLNEPFPESKNSKQKFVEIAYVGVFVAVFLFVFNPFGLQNMPLGVGISSLIFGLITVVFCSSYYWAVSNVINVRTDIPSWTLWKWLLSTMIMTCWVAVGNFSYLMFSLPQDFDLSDFPTMLQYTVMVGITPMIFTGMLIQMRSLKDFREQAKHISARPVQHAPNSLRKKIKFDNGASSSLEIDAESIIFVEAMQNYLMVHYQDNQRDIPAHQIVRSTLTNAVTQSSGTCLFRCHRSFIVNLLKVVNIDGNAQGLKLQLERMESREIPVSRSYVDLFKSKMQELDDK